MEECTKLLDHICRLVWQRVLEICTKTWSNRNVVILNVANDTMNRLCRKWNQKKTYLTSGIES